MTSEEILAIPAGPEMDELIAKYVMKLERTKPGQWRESVDWWVNGLPSECPDYSTDISAAWEVVEKMSSKFIGLHKMKFAEGKWFALYLDKSNDDCEEIVEAETPMLAICLAALLSVEER